MTLSVVNLVAMAAFGLIMVAVFLVAQAYRRLRNDPIRDRLAVVARENAIGGGKPRPVSSLTESLAHQFPQIKLDNGILDQDLRRAGMYRPEARQEYLALRNLLTIAALIITGMIVVVIGPEHQALTVQVLIVGIALTGLAWGLPRLYLKTLGKQRVERIQRGLPDALDMITMCLTGGLSMQDSLTHVSQEVFFAHPDLAVELLIVRQQADMTSLDQAFRQFARRVDAPEIISMTALITQSQRLGTDVVNSIRAYADSIRQKRRQMADERASKASIKMLFPLTLCMVPSVFILLWGPAVLELRNFFHTFNLDNPTSLL